jgi:hypothetical protein
VPSMFAQCQMRQPNHAPQDRLPNALTTWPAGVCAFTLIQLCSLRDSSGLRRFHRRESMGFRESMALAPLYR